MLTPSVRFGLTGLTLALFTTLALASPASAADITFEIPSGVPTDASYGATFTFDFDVKLPAGDYQSLVVALSFPTASFTVTGSGSPTSGEFGNAAAVSGGLTWSQVAPLDLTGGAATRRFRVIGRLDERENREGKPFGFSLSVTGNVTSTLPGTYAPVTQVPLTHTVTGHGTTTFSWEHYGSGNGAGAVMSGEATPRPGILRRFAFYPVNDGNAAIDSPVTYTTTFGSGYTFVRAFGDNWTPTFIPNPNDPSPDVVVDSAPVAWTAGAGTVVARSTKTNQPRPFYVDVFVPCAALGKTAEGSSDQGGAYAVSTTATATARHHDGTVLQSHSLVGTALGSPYDLTRACGQGGWLGKSAYDMSHAGQRHTWSVVVNPPFGVPSMSDAMIVDVIGAEVTDIAGAGSVNAGAFSAFSCNFSTFTGYFTVGEFLTRRATHCRAGYAGYQAGDTHLVHYAASWGPIDGTMQQVEVKSYFDISPTYIANNPGGHVDNTAYFNGTPQGFAAVGDTAVETGTEDPFEASASSDAFPSDTDWRTLMTRHGNRGAADTSPYIDANGGAAKAFAHVWQQDGLFVENPSFTISYPDGIILDAVPNLAWDSTWCFSAPSPATSPGSGPWTSPLAYGAGNAASPWALAGDACELVGELDFHVDPTYPWVDGQAITFVMRATAHGEPEQAKSLSYYAQVTTGMDVLLEGECWTDTSIVTTQAVSPPAPGLALYKATAVNRGSETLADMDLYFIVPPGGVFVSALTGPDFPSGAFLEVSHDGGSTWTSALPTAADASVTHVRLADFTVIGDGVLAKRPSFYVGIQAATSGALLEGGAWVETTTFSLGDTPVKEVTVDSSTCVVPCDCPDPTPTDSCSTGGCDAQGACIQVNEADGTSCSVSDACVTAAQCVSGACTPLEYRDCDDKNICTLADHCDSASGQCVSDAFDCSAPRVYLPVWMGGRGAGAVSCALTTTGTLACDQVGGVLTLRPNAGICGQ